ncbi:MAG: hypothetical protein ACRYFR_12150 [Janthinobacterium lividum]
MYTTLPKPMPRGGWKWSRLVPLLLLGGGLAPLAPPAPQVAFAQMAGARTVAGKVTSDNGEALSGVTVVVKGTTVGATTSTLSWTSAAASWAASKRAGLPSCVPASSSRE